MPLMAAMDDEALYVAELLGCIENIKNGNTSVVENIFMPPRAAADPEDAAFRALRDSGIRGTVARATEMRHFDPRFCETPQDQAKRVGRLAATLARVRRRSTAPVDRSASAVGDG